MWKMAEKDKENNATNFSTINSSKDLKLYLSAPARIKKDVYLFHYTTLSSAISIIKSNYLILFNPKTMNDGLEFENYSEKDVKNIFFASFMLEQKESIAMWAMYSTPWDDGVKISINGKAFKKWLKKTKYIYQANSKTKKVSDTPIFTVDKENIKLSNYVIAYVNDDDSKNEIVTCGGAKNNIIKGILKNRNLLGYVKNSAWEYEKEYRVRIDVKNDHKFDAVALKMTPELIENIEIVAGPRFKGSLEERIKKEIDIQIKTDKSLFTDKLTKMPCDKCDYKNYKTAFCPKCDKDKVGGKTENDTQ